MTTPMSTGVQGECHAIGQNAGRDMFAAAEPAWHGLGHVTGKKMTAREALTFGNLDWSVWVESLPPHMTTRPDGTVTMVAPPEWMRACYREDGEAGAVMLGTVGSDYQPIQTAEALAFLDNVTDMQGESYIETIGGLHDGREVFATVTWPSHLSLRNKDGREDAVHRYLLVHTGHAGNASLSVRATNVRVVCRNTLTMALHGEKERVMRVRHTGNTVAGRIAEARETLGFATASFGAFDAAAAVLFDQDVTDKVFEKIVTGFLGDRPEPKSAEKPGRALTMYDEKVEQVWATYRAPQNEPIRDTAWGAWNALTEWSDWQRPVRLNGREEKVARATAILSGNAESARDKALAATLKATRLPVKSLQPA